LNVSLKAERPACAFELDFSLLVRDDLAGGNRRSAFHVHRDLANVAVEPHTLEERIRHQQLTIRPGMEAVAAADVVL
jgi:hypothetical protein